MAWPERETAKKGVPSASQGLSARFRGTLKGSIRPPQTPSTKRSAIGLWGWSGVEDCGLPVE